MCIRDRIRSKYYHQGKVYFDLDALKPVYETNPKSKAAYENFVRQRKFHRILTFVGISSSASWGIWFARGKNSDRIDKINKQVLSFLFISGSMSLIVVSGIPVRNNRNLALKIFNEELLSSKTGANPPNLDIKTSNHGIGLVLNF